MKYIGVELDGERWVATLDHELVRPIAPVDEFWAQPDRRDLASVHPLLALSEVTEVPYIPDAARILCIGLNYRAHAAEGAFEVPEYPTIFGRWTPSLAVGGQPAPVPDGEEGLDWEGEVAVVLGRHAQSETAASALDAIFGYAPFNDLTSRRAQKLTAQWTLGKNGDSSGPMGRLVSASEVGDLRDGLNVRTLVNGQEVQNGNTRDMIFTVGDIIALVSQTLTLNPGDVIVSGTPEGVGYVRTPPWLLQPGDTVEVDIERIGKVVTPIADASARVSIQSRQVRL